VERELKISVIDKARREERKFNQSMISKRALSRAGFTLTELLVVIAIIGILAALILTALARAKRQTDTASCTSNLKQCALAVQLYSDDHGDQLPGPVWQGFYEDYDNQDKVRLPYYIASYAGLPNPAPDAQHMPVAHCPAAGRVWENASSDTPLMDLDRPLSYIVSVQITNVNSGVVTRPFGYPHNNPVYNEVEEDPKKLRDIANPSLSWAMTDADQRNAAPQASYYSFLPATPAHGDFRQQLFFDWHVDKVKPN
jgi:prepilin-type N-terminal cleavage/methylation domain-containing protein